MTLSDLLEMHFSPKCWHWNPFQGSFEVSGSSTSCTRLLLGVPPTPSPCRPPSPAPPTDATACPSPGNSGHGALGSPCWDAGVGKGTTSRGEVVTTTNERLPG